MVFTTGVWVVVVLLDEVVLSPSVLGAEVGSVLGVVEGTVGSGVEEGDAEVVGSVVVGSVVEEVEVVVGSVLVVDSSVEVSLEDVEVDEVVGVVSGASEVEEEVVRSDTMLETPALWAATAVNSRACMKSERLDRRMVGITNVSTE
jgi:hypothetical protein